MYIYRVVFLLILAIYVFSPIVIDWWIEPDISWLRPYALWAGLIVISLWLDYRRDPNEL